MHHTNATNRHDSDNVSSGNSSPNKQVTISPEYIRRISAQSIKSVENSPHSTIGKQTDAINSLEQNIPPDVVQNLENNESDGDTYYSIKRLQETRRGKRDDDSSLSRRVQRFYKHQDELIDTYERLHRSGQPNNEQYAKEEKLIHEKTKKISNILTKVSFGVNIILFVIKIIGAAISKSLSVVSSVIDSAVDLATSLILFWAWRLIKKRDKYRYPQGRTRLEPIAIIILSVIMCAASILVVYESINTITVNAKYFTDPHGNHTLQEIDMSAFPIVVMVVTSASKTVLFLLCFRVDTPTMSALAADHRNDVVSNLVALAFGLVGSFAYRNRINQKAIFVDPIGAILISFYIIFTWIRQAKDQIARLSGHTANPKFLSEITWLTFNHSPLIKKIDTVRAFYFGTSYLVEVDIVLAEDMPLKEAHDIGESLQKRIEELPDVERAFVHIDYEYAHNPGIEHKIV